MIHPAPTHSLHCQELDCVLPGCVNLKLGKMKNNIAKRTKKCGGHGRRPKLSHRGTEVKTALSKTHMTDHLWEDIQSVLRDGIEKTQGYTNHREMKDVSFGEEGTDVLDPCLGIQFRSHEPQPFHSWERVTNQCFCDTRIPFSGTKNDAGQHLGQQQREADQIFWEGVTNQCFDEFCETRILFSGTKNDAGQQLGQQQGEADQIVSDVELACQVLSDPLITKDSSEYACYDNKRGELENETALLHFDDFISMETRTFVQNLHGADDQQTPLKKGPLETVEESEVNQILLCDEINSGQLSNVGPSKKPFGTLSLLLQAFANPMSVELEQRCVHVLEKAYTEIRSVQSLHSFDCSE